MRLLVFVVNAVARPIGWLLSRADRDICAWPNETDEP
jgi:hypothetical protein